MPEARLLEAESFFNGRKKDFVAKIFWKRKDYVGSDFLILSYRNYRIKDAKTECWHRMHKAGRTIFRQSLEEFSDISLDRVIKGYTDAVMT